MNIVVTGSIAFDYLMSFPGKFTEHFLPEHMSRVSLSFLVDTMDKRRGGCAPNIAYTLALLGERPRLMATAGQDFGDYRAVARGRRRRYVARQAGRRTSSRASFFCSTDSTTTRSRRSTPAPWPTPASCRFATCPDCGLAIISPNDPGAMVQYAEECRDARHPLHLGSGPAVRAHVRRRARDGLVGRDDRHLQRLRVRADPAEDGTGRGGDPRASGALVDHARRKGLFRSRAERRDRRARGAAAPHRGSDRRRRRVSRRVHEGAWREAPATSVCAQIGSVAATYALEHLGGQSHAYTWPEFLERYEAHFGLAAAFR